MKYFIGLLITIAVIILIIIKLLTSGGGSAPVRPANLTDYADTDTTMRMTSNNAVQASQNHRVIQIDVGRSEATLTIFRGYEGEVLSTKNFPMNTTAYTDFLNGLKNTAGFTSGKIGGGDGAGVCATGSRTNYQIVNDGGKLLQNYWSTSCGIGSYKGLVDTTQRLFQLQIPDYSTLTQNDGF